MADIKTVLTDLSKEVAKLVDIAQVINSNNRGLAQEDPSYTIPVNNDSSFGKLTEVTSSKKGGYGSQIVINQSNKRDTVMEKIWKSVEEKKDEIIKLYEETFEEKNIKADIVSFEFSRFSTYSSGSKSIIGSPSIILSNTSNVFVPTLLETSPTASSPTFKLFRL